MKPVAIAVLLGLLAGWGIALLIADVRGRADAAVASGGPARVPRKVVQGSGMPPAPVAENPGDLDAQRRRFREGRAFSPYRDGLFSADLVRSLTPDGLVRAFRAGQIRDDLELAAAFGEIAGVDLVLALGLLEEIPGRDLQGRARSAVVRAAVRSDPGGLLEYLGTLPRSGSRAGLARELASEWARLDPSAALSRIAGLESLASPLEGGLADQLVAAWAQEDYAAAEEWVREKADPARRGAMLEALEAGYLAKLPPADAVDFLLARPDRAGVQSELTTAFARWARSDPAAAVERFGELGAGEASSRAAEEVGRAAAMSVLLSNGEGVAVLEWQGAIAGDEARRGFLLGAANILSSNDLAAAREVVAAIPESREREEAVGMLAELWMREDPVALSEWLAGLGQSPSRDEAVARFAGLLAKSDPERAAQWAASIGDEGKRQRVMTRIGEQ